MTNLLVPKYFHINSSIKTLDIEDREWFDKTYGNSYHSVQVTVNYGMKNQFSFSIPFKYGYGDHYKQSAYEALIKLKVLSSEGMYFHKLRTGTLKARASIETGHLQRDVKAFGKQLTLVE